MGERYGKRPSEMLPGFDDPLVALFFDRACWLAGTRGGEAPKELALG